MDKLLKLKDNFLIKAVTSGAIMLFSQFKLSLFILFIIIILDTVFGTVYALRMKRFSGRRFRRFLTKTSTHFILITTVRLMEIGISAVFETMAITHFMVSFLVVMEAISVLKNLALLGVPLPGGFVKIIMKYIKNDSLEELINAGASKQEYIREVKDIIDYQIPNIKSENMQKMMRLKFEEWIHAINHIDIQLTEGRSDNNDLLYYRVTSIISVTSNIVRDRWKEEEVSAGCEKSFDEWHGAKRQKFMDSIKEICYGSDEVVKKKKRIIERCVALLYETILDIQKGENNLFTKECEITKASNGSD